MAVAMRAKKIRHYSAPTRTVFSSKRIYRRNWYSGAFLYRSWIIPPPVYNILFSIFFGIFRKKADDLNPQGQIVCCYFLPIYPLKCRGPPCVSKLFLSF